MVVLLATACRPPEQAREVLALTNARVVDGNGGPVLDNVTLLIEAGRIALLGPTASVALPSGVRHVDLTGHVVMPGLIDMHYHVITGAMRYTRDSAGRLDSTYDRRLAERLLRTALAHGITTIRDPGASPVGAAIALREAVDSGLVPVCCAWRPGTGRRPSAPLRGGNGGARQTCRPRGGRIRWPTFAIPGGSATWCRAEMFTGQPTCWPRANVV